MDKNQLINSIKYEKTFVLIKPDGVKRWLIGEIISRIERAGLSIVYMSFIQATPDQARNHYPYTDETWLTRLGGKSISGFEPLWLNAKDYLGTDDPLAIGREVAESLVGYFLSGPMVAIVVSGPQAVDMMRKIVWHTLPFKAEMGTIRWDFSVDTPLIANIEKRSIHNLVHASETKEEAQTEMKLRIGEALLIQSWVCTDQVSYSKYY
jgi:nucleoside-diphosphate kinase